MTRRAKIVATLGPASSSPEHIKELITAGLDGARLNMSHGDHADHQAAYQAVRAASDGAGRRSSPQRNASACTLPPP